MSRSRTPSWARERLAWLTPPVLGLALAGAFAAWTWAWVEALLPAVLAPLDSRAVWFALAEAGACLAVPTIRRWAASRRPRAAAGNGARRERFERLLDSGGVLAAGLGLALGAWLGVPVPWLLGLATLPALLALGFAWRWGLWTGRPRARGKPEGPRGGHRWDARAWARLDPATRKRLALRAALGLARPLPGFYVLYTLTELLPYNNPLWSLAWAGLFWTAFQAARPAAFLWAGAMRQGRRWPERALLGLGWACSALAAWIPARGPAGLGALAGAFALAGLGLGLAEAVEAPFTLQAAGPEDAPAARAWAEALEAPSGALGCLALGGLWFWLGPSAAFAAAAVAAGCCAALLLLDGARAREWLKDL